MHSRRPYEPSRWPLELNTKMNHREAIGQFFDCQRFLYPTRRCARSLKKSPDGTSDGLRCPHEWPDDHTITADCQHFLHRVSIGGQHRHSVKPTLVYERKNRRRIFHLSKNFLVYNAAIPHQKSFSQGRCNFFL